MKHLLKLDVTPKPETIFEEREIDFPIYMLDGFNHSDTRVFDDGTNETTKSTEMGIILSPMEKVSISLSLRTDRDGGVYKSFEVVHRTLSKPKQDVDYYVKTNDTYDKPGTEEQFKALVESFKDFISCLSPYISCK